MSYIWLIAFVGVLCLFFVSHVTHFTVWSLSCIRQVRTFIGIYLSRYSGFDAFGDTRWCKLRNCARRAALLLSSCAATVVCLYLGILIFLVALCGLTILHPDTLLLGITALVVSLRYAVFAGGEPLGRVVSWLVTALVAMVVLTEVASVSRHFVYAWHSDEPEHNMPWKTFVDVKIKEVSESFPNNPVNAAVCLMLVGFVELALNGRRSKRHANLVDGASLGAVCFSRCPSSIPVVGRANILKAARSMIGEARTSIDWITSTNERELVAAINSECRDGVRIRVVTTRGDVGITKPHESYLSDMPIHDGFMICDDKRVIKTCERLFGEEEAPPHVGFMSDALGDVISYVASFTQAVSMLQKTKRSVNPAAG